jgi:hypothetical protein
VLFEFLDELGLITEEIRFLQKKTIRHLEDCVLNQETSSFQVSYILVQKKLYHLIWPPLVENWNWPSHNKICTFSTRKSTISIYRATSNFDFQSSRPRSSRQTREKKHAYIIFISWYNLLRVRRDQFLPNCKKNPPNKLFILSGVHRSFNLRFL